MKTVTKDLTLSPDNVHIWKIDLNQSDLGCFLKTLSSDEIARAERFYFPEHRHRFIVGRGSLRGILGLYLDVKPEKVEFEYQHRGKPFLAQKFANSSLFFNFSNSQNLALCAVTYQRLIGVDLEFIRPMSDLENLAKRFFLAREYELLKSLPFEQQQQIFFRYWTCKEAYLKATGDGLVQLEQIEISLTLNEPAKFVISEDWNLRELVPADNFAAAVVVAGAVGDLQFWEY